MKAIISSTYDDKYLFFIPIVTWLWNKLGVNVICSLPSTKDKLDTVKYLTVLECIRIRAMSYHGYMFDAPEHKQATYAQCSRLYAAALDLPEDEILITSDVDMALFQIPHIKHHELPMTIFGSDLVPPKQFPMCYASATVKDWRSIMKIDGRTYQRCLDDLLGAIETLHFRGNFWSKDQEELWNNACDVSHLVPRTNGQNQFATKRVDRDDTYWRDRLNFDLIDAHLWRPGFEENNFKNILELLRYFYPNDNLDWLIEYRNKYVELL